MKNFCIALVVSIALTGCATNTADKISTQSVGKVNNGEFYSDSEIMAIMFGGGQRNEAKLAARLESASAHPLGSKSNPVRVHKPSGQQAYLRRLNCDDGSAPTFNRSGSFGAGPYETIIDGYVLTCSGVEIEGLVYMDMYHPGHQEIVAIPGFTID